MANLLPAYVPIFPDGELGSRVFKSARQAARYIKNDQQYNQQARLHRKHATVRHGYVYRYPEYPVIWLKEVAFIVRRINVRQRRMEREQDEAWWRFMELQPTPTERDFALTQEYMKNLSSGEWRVVDDRLELIERKKVP